MNAALAYARQQRETASPERLMVLLFERAHQEMIRGATFLEQRKYPDATRSLTKASDIVLHLSATLNDKLAPALCKQLKDVYQFCAMRLTRAALKKDAKAAKEARIAFEPLVDAFRRAVVKSAGER